MGMRTLGMQAAVRNTELKGIQSHWGHSLHAHTQWVCSSTELKGIQSQGVIHKHTAAWVYTHIGYAAVLS